MSNSTSKSPVLTQSPWVTFALKYFPFKLTVSNPICINISAPLFEVIPTAWPVGNNTETIPSTGLTNLPSEGTIAIPFPSAPLANTWSETWDNSLISPLRGLVIISVLMVSSMSPLSSLCVFYSIPVLSSQFYSLLLDL